MKILGISGSPRKEKTSGVHKLVSTVLESTTVEYELVSLRKKSISGCIACLGCVKDNVCKVEDDLQPLRDKIVEADGYVIGAPNYYSGLNATTHALLERWFQFARSGPRDGCFGHLRCHCASSVCRCCGAAPGGFGRAAGDDRSSSGPILCEDDIGRLHRVFQRGDG